MSENIKVEPNLTELLKDIKGQLKKGLTEERANELLDGALAKQAKTDPPKTVEKKQEPKEEVISKAGKLELVEFDPDAPQTLSQIHKSESKKEHIVSVQKAMDEAYIISQILKCDPRLTKPWGRVESEVAKSELGKAMTVAGAGSGAEWIPTGFSADLVDKIRLRLLIGQMFERVKMTQNPMTVPRVTGDATAYLATSEKTATTESNVSTGNVTLTAAKLMVHISFSTELDEDSIIAIMPLLKGNVIRVLGDAEEDATINGDTSVTHQDSDVTGSTDRRKAWKGLRYTALATTSRNLSTFNFQTVLRLMQDLGDYSDDPDQLFWIVGAKLGIKLLNLKDEQNNPMVTTKDVLGDQATFVKGQLGVMAGVPIIKSGKMRETLNASGVYDGSTTTKGTILLVRKDAFFYGDWRTPTVKTDEDITTDDVDLVATMRVAFEDRIPDTETTVGIGYNIDPSA